MRWLAGPLMLVAARARRRPGRWLLAALGIACAAAFAGSIATAAIVTADHSARRALAAVSPLARSVRVTWGGVVTPTVERQARGLLAAPGLGPTSEVLLMQPVRLGGVVVRPAAVAPLARWLGTGAARAVARCRPADCPMLLAGGGRVPAILTTEGARIRIVGTVPLRSAVPLGFAPATTPGMPVLISGDPAGLDALGGLSGIYRSRTWVAEVTGGALHSWDVAALETRLLRAQANLLAANLQYDVSAPFTALGAARAQARAAPRRLLLAGGGALVALVLFVILAAAGLRADQRDELARLGVAGARSGQGVAFVIGEAAWLAAVALLVGALVALAVAFVLSGATGEPAGPVLAHSLLIPAGAVALAGGWVLATALLAVAPFIRGYRLVDALALAAAAALIVALALGDRASATLAVLLAPLGCFAAGVLIYRAIGPVLRLAERGARRGPVLIRLALVGLARAPALPALAIAFLAVSVGLGGFALAYRATLVRGAADQAADRVPLAAIIAPGAGFATPLELAPATRWRELAGGEVLPVRRTDATYASAGSTVTVPALGVAAAGLTRLHGWRQSDGSAPLATLGRRLTDPAMLPRPGPALPAGATSLALRARSPALRLTVTADLRDPRGGLARIPLGVTPAKAGELRTRLPAGSWRLEALELAESSGLEITSGHQNGENPAAATQATARLALGPVVVSGPQNRALTTIDIGAWRGVGAATTPAGGSTLPVAFQTGGAVGVLRPAQPTDSAPIPVLVDPQTAAAAGAGGRLALTIDALPVPAHVVGIVRRVPTLPTGSAGVVVADEAILAGALDAQLPGQGRPDEVWLTRAGSRLRAALREAPLSQLTASFRADLERSLRTAPLARGVLGVLLAAAALCAVLAVLGLLLALLAGFRDRAAERDLESQGVGPHDLRLELRLRLAIAAVAGVLLGVVLALVLTRFAVVAVRAAATVAAPQPPLVTVIPLAAVAGWSLAVLAVLLAAAWVATRRVGSPRRRAPARHGRGHPTPRTAVP